MKQTVKLTEEELKNLIREAIENMEPESQPQAQPKFQQGEMVAVINGAADAGFGPEGHPAVIGNSEWSDRDGQWMYFCIHTSLPRRGWFREDQLQSHERQLHEAIQKALKKVLK